MDAEQLSRFYAFLLGLFPRRHRDEFGAEMQAVFDQLVKDTERQREGDLWRAILRELRDVPRFALREQWLERKRPPYHPAVNLNPLIEHQPSWAILATAGIYFMPVVLALIIPVLPAGISTLLGILLGGITISTVVYGLFHDSPTWTLPFIGLSLGVVGVYVVFPTIIQITEAFIESTQPTNAPTASPYSGMMHPFLLTGMLWASIGAVVVLALLAMRSLPLLHPLYSRLVEDWTLLTFLIYGAVPLVVLSDFINFRIDEPLIAGNLLLLGGGSVGFLRSSRLTGRVIWLLAPAGISLIILAAAEFLMSLLKDQSYSLGSTALLPATRMAVMQESISWIWAIIALTTPWLICRRPTFAANLALVGSWAVLFHPIYPYLWIIFTRQEFRLNQFALIGAIGLAVYQARRRGFDLSPGAPPALNPAALVMLMGSSAAFILAERVVDINTLSAALFGLSFYGLIGLWLSPRRWRQGMPAALLLIATLPFGEHLQTFVGYPVRLITASLVRDGLEGFGVHSIGVDTILVFENGISQIDLPCSGVKSLWTGGMFLLAATWIERRRFHRRWIITALIFSFLLFLANLIRVAVLVVVGQVLEWNLLAEMLHVPLGVLGFAAACAVLVWMLRSLVPSTDDLATTEQNPVIETPLTRPRWLTFALLLMIAVLLGLYSPRAQPAAAQGGTSLQFQPGLATRSWPFNSEESAWLFSDGPLSANRWRFEWQGYSGSLLLITSDTWRAHHRPERCFEAYGFSIEQSYTRIMGADFPIRQVSLSAAGESRQYTAVYWLQANDRVTDDYATRIWSDLAPERKTWVLVTILFDQSVETLDPDLQDLYAGLRQAVDQSLQAGIVK